MYGVDGSVEVFGLGLAGEKIPDWVIRYLLLTAGGSGSAAEARCLGIMALTTRITDDEYTRNRWLGEASCNRVTDDRFGARPA